MPIYEYECHVCGHRLEKLQKISDQPLTDCPACEQSSLKKLVSAVAFRLSGSGWYETDFKDEKSRRNLAKDEDRAGASDTSDNAKTASDKDSSKDKGATTDGGGAGKETKPASQPSGDSAAASPPAG